MGEQVSVGVRDLATGVVRLRNPGLRVAAASVVKVDIMVALLLGAQEAGRGLTAGERELATAMICESDNEAATALWRAVGGAAGLAGMGARMGLRGTSYERENGWGASLTSVGDRLRLLSALAEDGGRLWPANRAFALGLMSEVRPGQGWGISAVARAGGEVAVKNGWLAREADGGTWTVNSMGRVTGPGRDLLIAVVSRGHRSLEEGVRSVERAVLVA